MVQEITQLFERYKFETEITISKEFVKTHKQSHVEDILKAHLRHGTMNAIADKLNTLTLEKSSMWDDSKDVSAFGTLFIFSREDLNGLIQNILKIVVGNNN